MLRSDVGPFEEEEAMVRRFAPFLIALVVAFIAVGCGGDDDVTIDTPNGGVDVGDGGITVEGPSGGEVNIGTGEYPEGWPQDFPVPDGATPAYSIGAEGGVSVWFATDQSADEVKSFFESALPAAGYTIDSQMDFSDDSGGYTVMSISGNGWTGGIYLGEGVASAAVGYEGDFDFWVSLSPAS
jgi:hypothetical protein